jgi:serine/threonine protein kinase
LNVNFAAPEVIANEPYSFTADWFSLGVVLFEMIQGHTPFRRYNELVYRSVVESRVRKERESYSSKFSVEARDLCEHLLQKRPADRFGCDFRGVSEIKKHAFFRSVNWKRMEAGVEQPPFVPDVRDRFSLNCTSAHFLINHFIIKFVCTALSTPQPHAVYARDVLDIPQFSTVKGVQIDASDKTFYAKFNTGSVSIPWQREMIETNCYKELNKFDRESDTNSVPIVSISSSDCAREELSTTTDRSLPPLAFGPRLPIDLDLNYIPIKQQGFGCFRFRRKSKIRYVLREEWEQSQLLQQQKCDVNESKKHIETQPPTHSLLPAKESPNLSDNPIPSCSGITLCEKASKLKSKHLNDSATKCLIESTDPN